MDIRETTQKLIALKRSSGSTLWFVATVLPDKHLGAGDFRFRGEDKFSGMVFCSSLEGEFLEAYRYRKGGQKQPLYIAKRSFLKEKGLDVESSTYTSLRLHDYTPSATSYYWSEGGSGGGTVDPPEIYCPLCNQLISRCSCDEIVILPTCFVCQNEGLGCG